MGAEDYQTGGVHWVKVQLVMKACSVSRLKAVSALKTSQNDEAAAIESLSDIFRQAATRAKPAEITTPEKPGETGAASNSPTETDNVVQKDNPEKTNFDLSPPSSPTADNPTRPSNTKPPAGQTPTKIGRYRFPEELDTTDAPDSETPCDLAPSLPTTPTFPPTTPTAPQKPEKTEKPESVVNTTAWNFHLPEVELDDDEPEFSYDEGRSRGFSARRLISSIQMGLGVDRLQHYLSFFDRAAIRRGVNEVVCGYPAIFYMAATNDARIIRAWTAAGADVNVVDTIRNIPLLAFAILVATALEADTTDVVVTLLSLGAAVSSIPTLFFSPYLDDPDDKLALYAKDLEFREPLKKWCIEWVRPVLASHTNLSQRYFLDKTTRSRSPSDRKLQVAQLYGATPLLGVSYFLVGQTSAAQTVTSRLLSHLALPKSKPLVMVFAGPSGHGKTELARRMGELLSLEIETADCTEMKHESDLFGPKWPYLGYDKGSPVNNFLARNGGKRCIVFLDEFEKTTREVQNALLIPFDEGRYIDRRSRERIDCSQTIWVIATNAVDGLILDFCETRKSQIFETDDQIRLSGLMDELSAMMKKQLKTHFGNPLSGRISVVIPFLPFSTGEAAVVVHKYILELKRRVKQDIKVAGKQLVGNVLLDIRRDGAICEALADEGYDSDQGARSLKSIVDARVQDELVRAYLEEEGRIRDGGPKLHYTVDIAQNGVLSVRRSVVSIS